jgi:heme A synthase
MGTVKDETYARRLGRVYLALVGLTWLLIVFGAIVRAHGAGLACPDWPYCFGSLLPRMDFRVLLEWGHRVVAAVVSVLFLAASWFAVRNPATRGAVRLPLLLAAIVLPAQIVLGGLTVLHLLASWSVTLHLLLGNAFCLLLLLVARRLLGILEPVRPAAPAARALAIVLAGALLVQIVLGGLVSSNYAGLACPDWPACREREWFPGFDGLVGLHLAHRLGGYVVAFAYLALAVVTVREPLTGNLARIGLSLVLFQILIGVANVLGRLPVEITALHSAVATLIVLVTTMLARAILSGPARVPEALGALSPPHALRS